MLIGWNDPGLSGLTEVLPHEAVSTRNSECSPAWLRMYLKSRLMIWLRATLALS